MFRSRTVNCSEIYLVLFRKWLGWRWMSGGSGKTFFGRGFIGDFIGASGESHVNRAGQTSALARPCVLLSNITRGAWVILSPAAHSPGLAEPPLA